MHMKAFVTSLLGVFALGALVSGAAVAGPTVDPKQFSHWLLPDAPAQPADNLATSERIELGKKLFFDPRLSRDGNMSCASCHNPALGWSDGLPTARGFQGQKLGRATPTIVNTAYNSIQMWDGRKKTLEDQAMGPLEASVEMNADMPAVFGWLASNEGYRAEFARAYPGQPIDATTVSKAIAAFERTVVSKDSPFDRWLRGDAEALSAREIAGFQVFLDPGKGNCAGCHQAPNFTDDGFHNLGLKSWGAAEPDVGRFAERRVASMKGAFKTPTLRDVALTAPYFHDGSARTLMEVVEHYEAGGVVKTNLSPEMKPLTLTQGEKEDLVAFLRALTSPASPIALPQLPAADDLPGAEPARTAQR